MVSLTCGIKKKDTSILTTYKTVIDSQIEETNLWLPKWKGTGYRGINEKFGIDISTLLYME